MRVGGPSLHQHALLTVVVLDANVVEAHIHLQRAARVVGAPIAVQACGSRGREEQGQSYHESRTPPASSHAAQI